jgi:large repetitive protein
MKTLLKKSFIVSLFFFCSPLLMAQPLSVITNNNTSCAQPNGAASATVNGQTQGYAFKWYAGPDETGPVISTQASALNLVEGTYTVKATDAITGAVIGPVSAVVLNETVIPVISVVVLSNVTSCVTPNGSLKAVVEGLTADYTFTWYDAATSVGSGPVLDSVAAGVYSVSVIHNITQCETQVYATVADERVIPELSVEIVSNITSCTAPNGALKVNTGGQESDYFYEWYSGVVLYGGPLISVNSEATNLSEGTYTVVVTDKITQCLAILSASVVDEIVIPNVWIEVVSSQTSCAMPNGALKINVDGQVADYFYDWYPGVAPVGPVISQGVHATNLSAGTYTVVIKHKITQCQTIISAQVPDETVIVTASIEVTSADTSCGGTPNGALHVTVAPGAVSDYTYQWFEGFMPGITPVLSMTPTLDQVSAGTYTVSVTHTISQCQTIVSASVPEECTQNFFARSADNGQRSSISIYPNPTAQKLWIRHESGEGHIVIADLNGEVVHQQKLHASSEPYAVDLTAQPAGMYILTFTSGTRTSRHHIMKQ